MTSKTTANHPLNGVPHAHIRESTKSTSTSSRSLFISFSIGFFPWLHRQLPCSSRRLESSGLSSSIVSKVQTSPNSNRRPSRSSGLSLARWISLIRMKDSYAHMGESTESISASSFSLMPLGFFVSFLSPSASSLIQSFASP